MLTREICCQIEGDAVVLQECGFTEDETVRMLPEILKGIQEEKRLLRLIQRRS